MAEAQKIAELEKQLQRQLAKRAEAEDKAKAALNRATKAEDARAKLQAAIASPQLCCSLVFSKQPTSSNLNY